MSLPPVPQTLREALQVMALRRERDERWVQRLIRRARQRALLCRACAAAVTTLRDFMDGKTLPWKHS